MFEGKFSPERKLDPGVLTNRQKTVYGRTKGPLGGLIRPLYGPGVIAWENGSRYEGEMFENEPHGLGIKWSALNTVSECGYFRQGVWRKKKKLL